MIVVTPTASLIAVTAIAVTLVLVTEPDVRSIKSPGVKPFASRWTIVELDGTSAVSPLGRDTAEGIARAGGLGQLMSLLVRLQNSAPIHLCRRMLNIRTL